MNQQFTARGPASSSRAAAWAAFEAAVIEANGVVTPVRAINKGFWKALSKRKLHLVAAETLPNRNQVRVRRLGAEEFEWVQVQVHEALQTDHWSDFAVCQEHSELARRQAELFKELGRPPRPREIAPAPAKGLMTVEEVVNKVEEFLAATSLPRKAVTVAGKAALVLHGVVPTTSVVELLVSPDHDITCTAALPQVTVQVNPQPQAFRENVCGVWVLGPYAILSAKVSSGDRTHVNAIRRLLGHRVR